MFFESFEIEESAILKKMEIFSKEMELRCREMQFLL
jgi:hypothetical protein